MSTTTAFLNVGSPRLSRWSSSAASTSSMSSTFSDLETQSLHSVNSTASSSSSPPGTSGSKTNAFFASPFNTRPPSPSPIAPQVVPVTPPQAQKPRSLTADFFATPIKPPSPPPNSFRASSSSSSSHSPHSHGHGHSHSLSSSTSTSSAIHPSHIFPSRYTSISTPHRSPPQFTLLTEDDISPYASHGPDSFGGPSSSSYHYPTSTSSSVLFASPTSPTFNRPRLPTPPPPPHPHQLPHSQSHLNSHKQDVAEDLPSSSSAYETYASRDEPTPRPGNREPGTRLLNFERSLLLERQKEREEDEQMRIKVEVQEQNEDNEEQEGEEEAMREGSIITLPVSAGHVYGGAGGLGSGSGGGMGSGVGGGGTGLSPPVRSGPLPISPLALAFVLPETGTSGISPTTTMTASPTTTEEGSMNDESAGVETPRDGDYTGSEPTMLLPSPPYKPKQLAPSLSASTSTSSTSSATSSIATSSSANGSPVRRSFGVNPYVQTQTQTQAHTYAYTQHQSPSHPHSQAHHPHRNHNHSHHIHNQPHYSSSQPQNQHPPQLRLLRLLGHGAFSAVWLAEDMSRVPLTLVSRKSVRDLRRRASERSGRGGGEDKDRLKDREREREKERQAEEERQREWEAVREKRASGTSVSANVNAGAEREDMDLTPRPPSTTPSAVVEARMTSLPSAPLLGSSSPQPQLGLTQMQVSPSMPSQQQTTQQTMTPPPPKRHQGRLREGLRSMLTFSRGSASGQAERKGGASTVSVSAVGNGLTSSEIGTPGVTSTSTYAHTSTSPSLSTSAPISTSTPIPPSSSPSDSTPTLTSTSIPSSASVSAPTSISTGTMMDDALMRDASLRKFRARVRGTRPALRLADGRVRLDERDGAMGLGRVEGLELELGRDGERTNTSTGSSGSGSGSAGGVEEEVLGANLARRGSVGGGARTAGRLVAVKMTVRRAPRAGSGAAGSTNGVAGGAPGTTATRTGTETATGERKSAREKAIERARAKERQNRREEEERTRVRFVREVEVLKHISHPNITPLLAHLSTATHHILVLPYLPGGDLLGLVNNDVAWGKLSESVLRRIWIELCKAVGWMHGVGLVHRDIKLENILLTTPTFNALTPSSPLPQLSSLPTPPAPFIKLTDFGLSRFVELSADGETAEMLSTRCGSEAYAAPELVTGGGGYDARRTDAWACGVVLYALVGRGLPFGEGVGVGGGGEGGKRIGGERGEEARVATVAERRHWLMSIARGEWEWPGEEDEEQEMENDKERAGELIGKGLVRSVAARRIVERLLVRDPKKRARIAELWDEPWMMGGGTKEEGGGWWRDRGGVDTPATSEAMTISIDAGDVDRSREMMMTVDGRINDDAHAPQTLAWDGDIAELWRDVGDIGAYSAYASSDHLGMCEESHGVGGGPGVMGGVGGEEEEEENMEEEVEDGCLLDQEGIDSITRQEVV